MGEVYRATDTNLKRAVAIKVLPETVAADAERLAQFQREAEVLASLNHPNIAIIHGLEKSDGMTGLVMELVEGPTLADRIGQGPIPIDEALAIAKQIAEALEAAHEQGIIHRDLKPPNVKVRDDGTVKVLDFGLAKIIEGEARSSSSLSMSPTITTPAMTQAGLILGTAAYMSPEQAKGRLADKRSDVWAFGCVLFEMLAGRRVFQGDDVTDVLVGGPEPGTRLDRFAGSDSASHPPGAQTIAGQTKLRHAGLPIVRSLSFRVDGHGPSGRTDRRVRIRARDEPADVCANGRGAAVLSGQLANLLAVRADWFSRSPLRAVVSCVNRAGTLMNRLDVATPRLLWKLAGPSGYPEQVDQRA
jgi:serine/threonine protein kinase